MRRNLRFWTRFTWDALGMELAITGILMLFLFFNSDYGGYVMDGNGWLDVLALIPFYLIVATVFCIILFVMGTQVLYVSLLIACGEPRKNVYWGFQYHRFLLLAVTVLISGLLWALTPGELSAACLSFLPVIVTGMVIVTAASGLMGSAYVKWKGAGVVFMVLFFGCCGGMGGWLMASGDFDFSEISINMLEITMLSLPWQMVLAAVVLLAADLGVQWLSLRRREVKL